MFLDINESVGLNIFVQYVMQTDDFDTKEGFPTNWTNTQTQDAYYFHINFASEPLKLAAIPSDKDKNGEVIKEDDTKLIFWYQHPIEAFVGVIKKTNAISNRDHYFLWGAKKNRSSLGYQEHLDRQNPVLYGVVIGQVSHGHFYAFYAGNSSIMFRLEIFGRTKTLKSFLIIDIYDKLMMKFEYASSMPLIGFMDGPKLVAKIFPPKAITTAMNH